MADYIKIDQVVDLFFTDYFSSDTFCNFVIPACLSDKMKVRDLNVDIANYLSGKDEIARKNSFINDLYENVGDVQEPIKIALISDIHTDPRYQMGASSKCSHDGSCCQAGSGTPVEPFVAGKWGDYNCDLPIDTFRSLMKFVKSEVDPHMIMWGGDTASHDNWHMNVEETVKEVTSVSNEFI